MSKIRATVVGGQVTITMPAPVAEELAEFDLLWLNDSHKLAAELYDAVHDALHPESPVTS
jgi:hypothetical protein